MNLIDRLSHDGSKLLRAFIVKYSADITAGSLKVKESRVIAGLLLDRVSEESWQSAITGPENLLQTRSVATAKRMARLIRKRLETMEPPLWLLIKEGSSPVATQACLAAAIKHSALLADFFDLALREQYKVFAKTLSTQHWEDFIADCSIRDPAVASWSDSTVRKLRTVVFHILEQSGYIKTARTPTLQPVHLEAPVVKYLETHDADGVLHCMRLST